jgi:protein KRI1
VRSDIAEMKKLKRLEIDQKLSKLRAITGDASLHFDPDELSKDFDPAEYDRKMNVGCCIFIHI